MCTVLYYSHRVSTQLQLTNVSNCTWVQIGHDRFISPLRVSLHHCWRYMKTSVNFHCPSSSVTAKLPTQKILYCDSGRSWYHRLAGSYWKWAACDIRHLQYANLLWRYRQTRSACSPQLSFMLKHLSTLLVHPVSAHNSQSSCTLLLPTMRMSAARLGQPRLTLDSCISSVWGFCCSGRCCVRL